MMQPRMGWFTTSLLAALLLTGCTRQQTAEPVAKSDSQVAADVQNKINSDANLPNKQIAIGASNGVVTLTGTLASENERVAAATDAAQVDGVKTVVNNLVVDPTSAQGYNPTPEPASVRSRSTSRRGNRVHTAHVPVESNPAPMSSQNSDSMASNTNSSQPPAPVIVPLTVPSGSVFSVRTNDVIDTSRAQIGDTFNATLEAPIEVDGKIAIPAHADVLGRIADVRSAGKFSGASQLTLQLSKVTFGGRSYRIVTDTWSRTGASRGKNTAEKVGGGAALGAIIGALAGGGKGAAIGAGVGAGVGGGAQAVTHGQQIVLNPETVLNFTLRGPVTVTPAPTNRSRQRLANGYNN